MEKKNDGIRSNVTAVYIAYMSIVFPLFYDDNYINIMQAKWVAYIFGTGLFVAFMLGMSLADRIRRKTPKVPVKAEQMILAAMAVSWMISLALCENKADSFWGRSSKYTGMIVYLLGIAVIYYVGRYLVWNSLLTWAFLIGSLCVCLLQILNRWNIDPLGMYENLITTEYRYFISTIGQINYNAALDCVIIAVWMGMYLMCRETFSRIVYGVCMFVTFCGMLCCCSDSVFLGILVGFVIAAGYACRRAGVWPRLVEEVLLWIFSCQVIGRIYQIDTKAAAFWGMTRSLISLPALNWELLALAILLGVRTLMGVAHRKNVRTRTDRNYGITETPRTQRNQAWTIYRFFMLIGAAVTIYLLIIWQGRARFLGAERPIIWNKCIALFQNAPLHNKLFGYGFNNVTQALASIGEETFETTILQDAHSLFFNSVITSGIVGTALWIVFFAVLVRKALQKLPGEDTALLVILGVSGYLAQGLVNGPQILTTPIFLVELGIFCGIVRNDR